MSFKRRFGRFGLRILKKLLKFKPFYWVARKGNRLARRLFPGLRNLSDRAYAHIVGTAQTNAINDELAQLQLNEAAQLLELEGGEQPAPQADPGMTEEQQRQEAAIRAEQEKVLQAQRLREARRALQWKEGIEASEEDYPLVSVIVPNYNHAPYLEERLDTIYNQTYPNFEVILLDDCSKDNSREILNRYAEKYPEKTRTAFNEENAGKVFLQWNKGIGLAKGELIWIAESDDYSEPNFLKEMVKCFRYSSVMLAFARSAFMTNGEQTWSTEEYLDDIKTLQWDESFVLTAADAVKLGFGYKNLIANVSSAMFRNIGQVPDEVIQICSNMKLSSDWIFYLAIMKGGCLGYTADTVNYYRIHPESTSLKVQQTMRYYDEYEMVSKYVAQNYEVSEKVFEAVRSYLYSHYQCTQQTQDASPVDEHYNVETLKELQKHRKPNIAMGCFSLQSGGGETYPIYLANELHRQGCNVTLIDFNLQNYEQEVRSLLDPIVPLVRLRGPMALIMCLKKLNIDVIHTHHASVDEITAKLINGSALECKHVITLHGMYETVADHDLEHLFDVTGKSCNCFFYIADKNLIPFQRFDMIDKVRMQKIDNGLPVIPVTAESRDKYGIPQEALVLTIVSRGIHEKGWREGIEAVKLARTRTDRPIDLVLVGDGVAKEELEKDSPEYVHFMGKRSNVRDFFAMSDVGFLPTRFAGESYPLVIIEAMMCGKPIIATDVAEVKHQLTDEEGNLAGLLLTMHDGTLDVEEIADAILKLAEDQECYDTLQKRTASAVTKFDIAKIVRKYLKVYQEVTELGPDMSEEDL